MGTQIPIRDLSLGGVITLSFDARLISWPKIGLRRAIDTNTLRREATAVDRTVPALLGLVPAHDTLHMRADGTASGDIAILIFVHGDWLVARLRSIVSKNSKVSTLPE